MSEENLNEFKKSHELKFFTDHLPQATANSFRFWDRLHLAETCASEPRQVERGQEQ